MQKQKGFSLLIGIIAILAIAIIAFGGVFAYQYFAPKNAQEKTNISSLVYSADKKYSAFMEIIEEPNLLTSKIRVKNLQTNEDKIVKTESCCIDGVGCGLCPLPCQIKSFSPNNKYVVIDCGTSPARTVEVINVDTKKEISFSSAVNYIWSSNEEITFYEPRESDETPSPECKINVVSGVKDCGTQTADWKTYTNAEYGFEFKYPSSFPFGQGYKPSEAYYFYVVDGPLGLGDSAADLIIMSASNIKSDNSVEAPFSVSGLNDLAKHFKSYTENGVPITVAVESFTTNSGEAGIKVTKTQKYGVYGGITVSDSFFSRYYFYKSGNLFAFRAYLPDADKQINKIALTFKFTK